MKKKILMQLTAAALTAGMCISGAGAAFTDVSTDAWYYNAVTDCTDYGMMKGYDDGCFRPSANMTRAQCAQILSNLKSDWNVEIPYIDVQSGKWYYNVVRDYGMYMGGSYTDKNHMNMFGPYRYFYPEKACTREDFAMGLYHVLGWDSDGWKYRFNDMDAFSSSVDDYYNYIQAGCAVANNGLMIGDTHGNFNPKKNITRAEVAQVLSNYLNNVEG